jgi:FkbM family methyltransferase
VLISYAQNFEDVILWRALQQVTNGFYIDIGAQDPIIDSVSLAFYERGWRGIHIEPSPMYAEKLRQARPDETVIQAAIDSTFSLIKFYEFPGTGMSTGETEIAEKHQATGFRLREIEVPTLTLASLLDRYADREIHWLKIDVEGMENRVIESWRPSKVRPWILVVESTSPNELTPSHQAWDPIVLSLGYKFAYFDGLNRFYVSKVHPELKDAFLVGPNYFDDFALSGTSGIYCRVIQEHHRSQLSEMRLEFEKQHESSQQEIEHLSQVTNTQEQAQAEQARIHAEREQALAAQLERAQEEQRRIKQEGAARERDLSRAVLQSRQELEELLQRLAAREREVGGQLLLVRQGAEQDRAEQARIHAEREQALAAQLERAQEEQRRIKEEGAARERDLTRAVLQSRQELEELLQRLAAREKEVSGQLLLVRQGAEQDRTEQAQIEKALNKEIAGLQSEIQALNHARQLQTQQHGFELATKQDELSRLIQTYADHEAQFKNQILSNQHTILQFRQQIAEVQKNLAITRASLSWRITSPLRKLTSSITPRGDPGHSPSSLEQAEAIKISEPTGAASPPAKVQPSSQATTELSMPHSDPTINLSGPPGATRLDELLARHDQSFIQSAYQTLLGRDPDEEGLNYYLGRLRSGIPNIQILGQIRRSEEGRALAADLPGLDAAIRRYRWAHKAIIGWWVRLFVSVEGNNSTERKLRVLESQLFLVGKENMRRFNQMENVITRLHQMVAEQIEQINAVEVAEGSTAQVDPATPASIQPSDTEALKQLSPRARNIYLQLKTAAVINSCRVA